MTWVKWLYERKAYHIVAYALDISNEDKSNLQQYELENPVKLQETNRETTILHAYMSSTKINWSEFYTLYKQLTMQNKIHIYSWSSRQFGNTYLLDVFCFVLYTWNSPGAS